MPRCLYGSLVGAFVGPMVRFVLIDGYKLLIFSLLGDKKNVKVSYWRQINNTFAYLIICFIQATGVSLCIIRKEGEKIGNISQNKKCDKNRKKVLDLLGNIKLFPDLYGTKEGRKTTSTERATVEPSLTCSKECVPGASSPNRGF